jgi:putative membrane protein
VRARFLDDEARAAFQKAVETIEGASSVELVIAVRRRSARYLHANLIVGALVAFAGLAAMLYSEWEFGLLSILIDPFVVGLGAGALVELAPGIKRVLSPRAVRRREVERAARATFVERGVHNTLDRSGLLLYVSWLEQEIALVPDSGLARAFAPEAVARAEDELVAAMARGGAAVAEALTRVCAPLAEAMPRRPDDVNELPDAIDSDMPQRGRR